MPLLHLVVLAALQGLAEALPVSRSGHVVAARLWLEPGGSARSLEAVLCLGTALGLLFAARRRLVPALGEGVRAVARPSLFRESKPARDALVIAISTGISLAISALALPRVEAIGDAPTATGFGLVVTGLALASTRLAPRPHLDSPPLFGAALVGVAHGIAVFPGASRVGAAITVLLWIGVRPGAAVDLALTLTAPLLAASFLQASTRGGLDAGVVIAGVILAAITAVLGGALLRSLASARRAHSLAFWVIPLGLAMLAYARALPHPSS